MDTGTPRQRVEAECARRGRAHVVQGCLALLDGRPTDPGLVRLLAGRSAAWAEQAEPEVRERWLRVWALRGLLWAWDPGATEAVLRALDDEAWRVREMAAKVVARHRVDEALEAVAARSADPVPRVRAAAERALTRLTTASRSSQGGQGH